ncbi:MAG TPA: glycerophosphodiester phosphodiesterase [Vicinamibacterales bacterium]|nr:glycerophosphodiester phosphodiesterase [Vicinamibacterales bacterium]
MRHPFSTREKLVFAHRGGAKLAPENTMAAFENGLALGSDGLECDVHLSRDGVPVVIHDKTLERTTDAAGPVSARTAEELARVDAGYRFTALDGSLPFRHRGIGVPTLETVLRSFPIPRVIIEMKQADPALARAVLDVVRRTKAADRICIGSFYRHGLDVIRAEDPAIATSASENEARWTLYRAWCRWPMGRARVYHAFQVPERAGRMRVVSPAFVEQAHRAGARVDVWVVDAAPDVTRLFSWGVDGVITDRPDVAVPARADWLALSAKKVSA